MKKLVMVLSMGGFAAIHASPQKAQALQKVNSGNYMGAINDLRSLRNAPEQAEVLNRILQQSPSAFSGETATALANAINFSPNVKKMLSISPQWQTWLANQSGSRSMPSSFGTPVSPPMVTPIIASPSVEPSFTLADGTRVTAQTVRTELDKVRRQGTSSAVPLSNVASWLATFATNQSYAGTAEFKQLATQALNTISGIWQTVPFQGIYNNLISAANAAQLPTSSVPPFTQTSVPSGAPAGYPRAQQQVEQAQKAGLIPSSDDNAAGDGQDWQTN